jgi:hypothetical protein
MSYQTFPDKPVLRVGDLADPAQMNAAFDGLQSEFEERSAAAWLDGVVAGLECALAGSEVSIASGQAYVQGLLFSGGASVVFSSQDPPGTYFVYVDPADLANPYHKTSAPPGAGKLVLASVVWDGSDLSELTDLRPWGLVPACLRFTVGGAVSPGALGYAILERNFWIEDVLLMLAAPGTAGSTIVDVHVGPAGAEPATIFADQARRPQLSSGAPGYSVAASGPPDTNRRASAGRVLRVDVDAAATGAAGLAVVVRGRYY